ncbi:MAG: TIGR04086 family membrane protein [Firmicutes bacterium]|nr:TIGR04086 family membrane protein [Bacillota bacterium]
MAGITNEFTSNRGKAALEIVKALTIAIVSSLLLVLVFALLIKAANIPDRAIAPVNQAIKAISLLIGALFSFKIKEGGWKKGLLLGVIYIVAAFLIFSLLDGKFKFDITLLFDFLIGAVMGVICGVIAVNISHKRV